MDEIKQFRELRNPSEQECFISGVKQEELRSVK
jgi:hypothetical protein